MFAGILNPESWTANTGDVDNWTLTKDKNGQWGWAPDGSLDFNFDLRDKEIRTAFLSTFGGNLSIANIADDIGSIDFADMSLEEIGKLGFELGIKDPYGTKYLSKPGELIRDIALGKFIGDTEKKVTESSSRNEAINTYINNVSQLKANGVEYKFGGGDINSIGIVLGSSTAMDCSALVSYLTQTTRTSTGMFDRHNSFEKSYAIMPGDVIIYSATKNGEREGHAVIWLGGDSIVESADKVGPRYSTLRILEEGYAKKGYTFEKQSYRLKKYNAGGR
jgi:hypothetical protein